AVHDVRPGKSEQMVPVASLAPLQLPRRADVLLPARRGDAAGVEGIAVDRRYRSRALEARGGDPDVRAAGDSGPLEDRSRLRVRHSPPAQVFALRVGSQSQADEKARRLFRLLFRSVGTQVLHPDTGE